MKELEDLVILACEGILEIRIKPVERVLSKVFYFIPRVENRIMLISPRECQLYSKTTIYRAPLGFTLICFDCTVLIVEANKVGASRTCCATIPFPIQVLQPTLLEF